MKTCLDCKTKLIVNKNWYASYKRHYNYTCNNCYKIRSKKYTRTPQDNTYGTDYFATQRLGVFRYQDKKKNRSICNLTKQEFLDILQAPCTYCESNEDKISLDRIDNSRGHTKDNVVPCCRLCNTARMASFTHEETKLLGKTISKIRKLRRLSSASSNI